MAERELRVNELAGKSTQDSRLLLEVHSHCEVPAGCGGFVLRWRNPETGMPVRLWFLSQGTCELFLDGAQLIAGRPIFPFGRHLLAMRFSGFTAGQGLFMFAARFCPTQKLNEDVPANPRQILLSQADGSWRYCAADQSGDAWRLLDFDDSRWTPLVHRPIARPADNDYSRRRQYETLMKMAAEPLGSAQPADTVCVRRVINITHESFESR